MDELELYFGDIMNDALPTEERIRALKEFVHACVDGGYDDEEVSPGDEGGVALLLGEPKK